MYSRRFNESEISEKFHAVNNSTFTVYISGWRKHFEQASMIDQNDMYTIHRNVCLTRYFISYSTS